QSSRRARWPCPACSCLAMRCGCAAFSRRWRTLEAVTAYPRTECWSRVERAPQAASIAAQLRLLDDPRHQLLVFQEDFREGFNAHRIGINALRVQALLDLRQHNGFVHGIIDLLNGASRRPGGRQQTEP